MNAGSLDSISATTAVLARAGAHRSSQARSSSRGGGHAAPPRSQHDHALDGARRRGERLIDDRLERDVLALAVRHVGGEHQPRAAGPDPVAQRARPEAREHHRVDRADADGREHRDDGLGAGRHVDRDPVAPADAEAAQGGRGALDLAQQLPIGERPPPAALVEGDQRGLVAAAGRDL